MLYFHKPSDSLMAFNESETGRFHRLIGHYDGIEKIPDDETIQGIILQYNSAKNAYDIHNMITREVRLNELDYVWVQYPYR